MVLLRLCAGSAVLTQPSPRRLCVVLGWLLLSIAVYVYNGITDVVADAGNGSSRPIVSGRLSLRGARAACRACWVGGAVLCLLTGSLGVSVLAAMFALLGWAYSAGRGVKSHPIGAAVVIGAGAALTYGAAVLCAPRSGSAAIPHLMTMAGWVTFACSTKDFSDVRGDAEAGRRTLPVMLGPRRAANLLAIVTTVPASVLLAVEIRHGWGAAGFTALLWSGSLVVALGLDRSVSAASRSGRRAGYRAYMAVQYLVNAGLTL